MAAFERDVALQNELGVPSRMIDVAEAEALSPLIETDGLLAAAYSPDDGHCTPESVVLGYAAGGPPARRHPAHRRHGDRHRRHGGEARTVHTDRGRDRRRRRRLRRRAPGRARSGRWSGTPLPVTPVRRQILFTEPMPELAEVVPFTIDFATTYYFHREGRGLLLGMSDPDQEPGFHLGYSDDWLPRLGEAIGGPHPAAARRRPAATDGPGSTR